MYGRVLFYVVVFTVLSVLKKSEMKLKKARYNPRNVFEFPSMCNRMLYLLVLFLIFSFQNYGQGVENVTKHIGAGVVIGGVGGYAAHKIFNGKRGWTWAGAVGSSLAVGLAKETYDTSRGAQWETEDVLFTTLGGVISGLALDFLLKNRRRGRSGKNCGCPPIAFEPFEVDLIKASGSITAAIQANHILRAGL